MNFQDWMFDKRVIKRNIVAGAISRKDYQKYLDALPDMKNNITEEEEPEESVGEDEAESEPSEGRRSR